MQSGETVVYQVANDFNYNVQVDRGCCVVFRPQVPGRPIRILGTICGEGDVAIEGSVSICSNVTCRNMSIGIPSGLRVSRVENIN